MGRVYEYDVEPTTIQALPVGAVLLVQHDRQHGGKIIVSGDCNPDLLTLDRVSLKPLTPPVRVAPPAVQPAQISG